MPKKIETFNFKKVKTYHLDGLYDINNSFQGAWIKVLDASSSNEDVEMSDSVKFVQSVKITIEITD